MPKSEFQKLEEILLSAQTRKSQAELDRLIADDFTEFGSSGRTWNKSEVLEELPSQGPLADTELTNFEELELGGEHVLVKYLLDSGGVRSLRTSIWRRKNDGWEMLFHQGTRIP